MLVTDIDSLVRAVLNSRGTDTVLRIASRLAGNLQVPEALDDFVAELGFDGPGDQWREITRDDSIRLLSRVLERDLAYSVQLMAPAAASLLANQFIDRFAADARFFTNGTFHTDTDSPTWMPITDYTFDTGIVAVDGEQIGILWVNDED